MCIVCANFNCATFKSITKYCRQIKLNFNVSRIQYFYTLPCFCSSALSETKIFLSFAVCLFLLYVVEISLYCSHILSLYRKISPRPPSQRTLVASMAKQAKKYCILGFKNYQTKQKFSCLDGLNFYELNLYVLSSVENFFVSACSCELAK